MVVSSLFIYSLVGSRALMTLPVMTLVGQSVEGSRLTSRYSTASARLEPGLSRYQNSTWYQVLRASGNTQIPRRAAPCRAVPYRTSGNAPLEKGEL